MVSAVVLSQLSELLKKAAVSYLAKVADRRE
jgi:hypothetical protein